jgi:hypothetical protein
MSNYTYHGTSDLIVLPGRSVQTFPSGLVRVERSFVCRKADVEKYRKEIKVGNKMPKDDGAPAIDGLFIFPDPQEQVRDDGFVEFRVTAYGRTNTTGQRTALAPIRTALRVSAFYRTVNLAYNPNNSASEATLESKLENFIPTDTINVSYRFCVAANKRTETPTDIREIGGVFLADTDIDLFSQSFSAAEVFPQVNGSFVPPTNQRFGPVFFANIASLERSNFGKFDEIIMSFAVGARPIDFGSFFQTGSVPAMPLIESVVPSYGGAFVTIIIPPYSSGVRVTIGGESLSAPYGGSATGSTFSISGGTISGQFIQINILGLNQNTAYSASIAATNENGASASQAFQFATRSFLIS